MKHTPGPWKAEKSTDKWDVYAPDNSDHANEGDLIIVAGYCTEANAYLIKAAPDMFKALKDIKEQLRATGIPDWHGAEGLCLNQLDAAIDKAERRP